MHPKKNQSIHIIFKNGFKVDGIVEFWSDQKAVLRSATGPDLLIINQTAQDILLIQIVNSAPSTEVSTPPVVNPPTPLLPLTPPTSVSSSPLPAPSATNLRTQKLVELRRQKAKEEGEEARRAINNPQLPSLTQSYVSPSQFIANQYTNQKNTNLSRANPQRLLNLLRQKKSAS